MALTSRSVGTAAPASLAKSEGRVPKGRTVTAPIYLQDVIPTALEWAGAPVPDHVEFESLIPHLAGKGKPTRRSVQIGQRGEKAVEILKGLKAGDEVVVGKPE